MLLLRRVCAVSLLRRVGALVLLLQRVFAASLLRRLVFAVSLLLLSTLGCAQLEVHDGTSASCGTCHRAQAEAWRTSAHANSGTSGVFTALLPRVEASWGRTARARCEACHQPGHAEEAFVGCASCHLAVGNREDRNGALVVDITAPVAASTDGSPRAPHAVTARRFFSAPNLCGTCHEVKGPGHLDEPTLSEFSASPLDAGASCSGCHLDGHRFSGFSPALLDAALSLELDGDEVVLANVGAGHGVPTGMTSVRDVWVDVTFDDAAGAPHTVPRVIELGARLVASDGGIAALFTDAVRSESRSLALGASRRWSLPAGAKNVQATLRASAVRRETLTALGLPGEEAPVLEIEHAPRR
jgi:hypothetical protein